MKEHGTLLIGLKSPDGLLRGKLGIRSGSAVKSKAPLSPGIYTDHRQGGEVPLTFIKSGHIHSVPAEGLPDGGTESIPAHLSNKGGPSPQTGHSYRYIGGGTSGKGGIASDVLFILLRLGQVNQGLAYSYDFRHISSPSMV